MPEASFDLGGALQAGAESSNHLLANVAGKIKADGNGTGVGRIMSPLSREYARALKSFCANMVRDIDGLLWIFASRITFVSTRLDKTDRALLVKGKTTTKIIGSSGLVEPW